MGVDENTAERYPPARSRRCRRAAAPHTAGQTPVAVDRPARVAFHQAFDVVAQAQEARARPKRGDQRWVR